MGESESSSYSSVAELALLGGLLEEHRGRLLAMIQRRLPTALAARIDAEDILSQAFLDARSKWRAFQARTDITPYAWLYGIARDRLFDAWDFHTRQLRNIQRECPWPERSSMQLALGLAASLSSPSERLAAGELRDRMQAVLMELKEKDREILWMRHHDDLSFPDIAAVLSISTNAARVRYVRALDRLRTIWQMDSDE